jgi:hypothetical protein
MANETSAAFEIKAWDEQPFDEADGDAKLTRAAVEKEYSGDIEGSSVTEWLMAYHPDGTAAFVGIERIRGTVAGRTGSLVLKHVGTFAEGAAKAELTVLSGTGELDGVTGAGTLVADPSGRVTLALN